MDDAEGIVAIWRSIVAEKVFSAIDRPFTLEQTRAYIQGLSRREAVFVAQNVVTGQVVGFQSLDLWARLITSMDHVGQIGTFVLARWRGRGIGRQLAANTFGFARSAGYQKIIALVRASNQSALHFYASLGFSPCGRLARQTRIADGYDDEILMELFF